LQKKKGIYRYYCIQNRPRWCLSPHITQSRPNLL